MESYEAYTDGSYQDSIKAGGWASIILKDDKISFTLVQFYTIYQKDEPWTLF